MCYDTKFVEKIAVNEIPLWRWKMLYLFAILISIFVIGLTFRMVRAESTEIIKRNHAAISLVNEAWYQAEGERLVKAAIADTVHEFHLRRLAIQASRAKGGSPKNR